ncbi:MAG: glycosyltransferase [Dinoroseobacter sp.]|nr:glycosyltransferase [Dinoroseobacter sp.]
MKVLHCITSTGFGGAQIMLLRYLRALGPRACDHSVLSLMPQDAIGQEIASLGVPVHTIGMRQGGFSIPALLRLRRQIKHLSPDLIHGWMYHGNLAARLATLGIGGGPAVVWAVHHSLQDIRNERLSSRLVMRACAALSGGVSGISYCARVAASQHEAIGFASEQAVVIPNAIDTDEFHPETEARGLLGALLEIPEGRVIIGNVGRDHPMKDQARMVAAIAGLLERGYDVQGILIGTGQEAGSARRAAETLGISDRISTMSERSDIAGIVSGFDIFLLPSAWGEAFPLALCEAMACGVPSVVTDVGDSRWIVDKTGFVVPPADTDAQVDALARMVDLGPQGRQAMGAEARNRICQKFSMSRYIDAHDAWYRSAASRSQEGALSLAASSKAGVQK